jgi:hypothetical protein
MRTVTSGTGGFIAFSRRSSNGSETFENRFVQYGLVWRYSIFFVPAMISASHSRSIVVVIRPNKSAFLPQTRADTTISGLVTSQRSDRTHAAAKQPVPMATPMAGARNQ